MGADNKENELEVVERHCKTLLKDGRKKLKAERGSC